MTGVFLTLEGGEGVGKSTQALLLAEALRARGTDVLLTREPGGSAGAEAIRALLLEGVAERWEPRAEALLFAAARADHAARTIRPALAAGRWVISDRFLDSSLAYQGGADGIGAEAIRALHAIGSGGLLPDRTLLLTLPEREALARAQARDRDGGDRFGARDAAYHARVAAAFHALAEAEPGRFRHVSALGSADDVTRAPARRDRGSRMIHGHDANVRALTAAAEGDRLHHAWLLAGPEGIGKAAFADMAAAWLLARAAGPEPRGLAIDPGHPAAHLLAAGSHPDHARLERLVKEKGDRARNISIDQVRALARLFETTPTFSSRRTVVIDSVDELEPAGANALLKSLEEPPPGAVFLLVSHAPGRLLPTIRSRCRLLRFGALDDDAMTAVLRDHLPEADAAERAALIAAGEGAPGRALRLAGLEIGALDMALDRLMTEGDPSNALRAGLAKQLATKAALPRYEAFLERLPSRVAREAKRRVGHDAEAAIAVWERSRRIAAAARPLSLDAKTTVFELAGLLASLAPASADAVPRGR